MVLGGSQHVLPVPVSHMENVLSLQTRQIVLCCCFSPKAQPSIRRIRLPAFNIIEHFVKSNALYEFWEVFEKKAISWGGKLASVPPKDAGASDSSTKKTTLYSTAILWHKPLLRINFSGLVHHFISDTHSSQCSTFTHYNRPFKLVTDATGVW